MVIRRMLEEPNKRNVVTYCETIAMFRNSVTLVYVALNDANSRS